MTSLSRYGGGLRRALDQYIAMLIYFTVKILSSQIGKVESSGAFSVTDVLANFRPKAFKQYLHLQRNSVIFAMCTAQSLHIKNGAYFAFLHLKINLKSIQKQRKKGGVIHIREECVTHSASSG